MNREAKRLASAYWNSVLVDPVQAERDSAEFFYSNLDEDSRLDEDDFDEAVEYYRDRLLDALEEIV